MYQVPIAPNLVWLACLARYSHEPRSTFHHPNEPRPDFRRPVRRRLSDIHRLDARWFRRVSVMAASATAHSRHVFLSGSSSDAHRRP